MTPGFEGRSFGTCLPSSAGELGGGPLPRWPDGFLRQIPALSAHELPGRSLPMSCCLPLAADLIIFTAPSSTIRNSSQASPSQKTTAPWSKRKRLTLVAIEAISSAHRSVKSGTLRNVSIGLDLGNSIGH